MCGIVGYIGPRDATPIIINGLKRLEYRGYDSAGIAVWNNDQLEVRKDAGKLSQLIELVSKSPINGAPGIGHTRWATHGAPNARNAHPHIGQTGRMVVVQNGIVENFLELKDELIAEGVEFQSDTDTETIVHLVEHYLATGIGLVEAARKTFNQIRGANVVVLMSADEPDKIVTARIGNAGGVVLGMGDQGRQILAQGGFPAGEDDVGNADLPQAVEDSLPLVGGKLGVIAGAGIVTVGALVIAAVGEGQIHTVRGGWSGGEGGSHFQVKVMDGAGAVRPDKLFDLSLSLRIVNDGL